MMERTSQNLGAAGAAIASGGNPFFRSLNQSYGEPWKSSGGVNPLHLQETPEYKDLVSYWHPQILSKTSSVTSNFLQITYRAREISL